MEMVYKLIALSVVFGLVIADPVPAPKVTHPLFDDLTYEAPYPYEIYEDKVPEEISTVDLLVEKPFNIAAILGLLKPLIVTIKSKAIALAVAAIKWLAPKGVVIAIGVIATLVFCKLTNLCSLAYDPVVYSYVPAQVRSFVTPERLEDAHSFFMRAMQEYARKQK